MCPFSLSRSPSPSSVPFDPSLVVDGGGKRNGHGTNPIQGQEPVPGTSGSAANATNSSGATALVKYGELIILGYNGTLPQGEKEKDNIVTHEQPFYHYHPPLPGDRGRRRSKFVLYRRQKANGVSQSRHYKVKTPQTSQAILNSQQHSISFTLSRSQV